MGAMSDRQTHGEAGVPRHLDLVIVGAGFAGMYMLVRARQLGFTASVIEAGQDVGGTWYWNRYPGARCDIESLEYSYGFDYALQQEWKWSERFAPQPEILAYARHVAERFDLARDIRFGTRVTRAWFDAAGGQWSVGTDTGLELRSRFVVMATGSLSSTNLPAIPGRESFMGPSYHTGAWPHEPVDFTGKRVGVIGTGSSAVQSIPVIAAEAAELHVFQRTAAYSVPAHNASLDADYEAQVKADYREFRRRNELMPAGFGSNLRANEQSALAASAAQREVEFEQRWRSGGLGSRAPLATSSSMRAPTSSPRNSCAARSVSWSPTRPPPRCCRRRNRWPASACVSIPATTGPSTCRMCIWSISAAAASRESRRKA